jgi:uncharacterized protein DUF6484
MTTLKVLSPIHVATALESHRQYACRGRVVALDDDGVLRVDFSGNPHGPIEARVALSASDAARLARRWKESEVLIVFADGDVGQPIVTGILTKNLKEPLSQMEDWETFRRLLLKADEELVLECGEAKIVLRRDGKLTILGKEIVSRALGRHRIKGATIDIN